jgi:hypothetical protein
MTTAIRVVNANGRAFVVKIVREGDKYGLNKCLTHDDEKGWGAMVEFYDETYAGKEGFDPEGQFVSRYYVETILGKDDYGSGEGGLNLDGGVDVWTVDAAAMAVARGFLKHNAEAKLVEPGLQELVAAARDLFTVIGETCIDHGEFVHEQYWQDAIKAQERLRVALKPFDEVEV